MGDERHIECVRVLFQLVMTANVSIIEWPRRFYPLIHFKFHGVDLFDDPCFGHLINPLGVRGDIGKTGDGGIDGTV